MGDIPLGEPALARMLKDLLEDGGKTGLLPRVAGGALLIAYCDCSRGVPAIRETAEGESS